MPPEEQFLYRVVHHTGVPEPHFDLMIEVSRRARLPTWRCPVWPILKPTAVQRLEDHRRVYLQHSGPIAGNRGSVSTTEFGIHRTERRRGHWVVKFSQRQTMRGVELQQLDGEKWEARPLV